MCKTDERLESPEMESNPSMLEKDLILAAEVGQALLERNEELEVQMEQLRRDMEVQNRSHLRPIAQADFYWSVFVFSWHGQLHPPGSPNRPEPDLRFILAALPGMEHDIILNLCLFQALQQEKHVLQRRLEVKELEAAQREAELQADITLLRKQMDQNHHQGRDRRREENEQLTQLSNHNQKLVEQLAEVS